MPVVKPAFEKAHKGLAVNFLNATETIRNDAYLRGYDPKRLSKLLSKRIGPNELIEGYLPNDFTLIFKK